MHKNPNLYILLTEIQPCVSLIHLHKNEKLMEKRIPFYAWNCLSLFVNTIFDLKKLQVFKKYETTLFLLFYTETTLYNTSIHFVFKRKSQYWVDMIHMELESLW